MKIKYPILTAIVAGVIILGIEYNHKKTSLELITNTKIEKTIAPNQNYNSNSQISMHMSEFEKINIPLNHIDPNLLISYTADFNAPTLKGEIIKSEFGYFENNKFVKAERYFARHIEQPNNIFCLKGFPNYQWKLIIKKPEKFKDKNFVKEYSVFKARQEILDKNKNPISCSDLYFFLTQGTGNRYIAISQKIIPVWNSNINRNFKNPKIDSNDPNVKPIDYLYLVQHVPEQGTIRVKK
jgi:hypothetical protein